MTCYLFYMRFSFFGGWGRGVVTGFKIVTTIVAKSRDTLNTITIPKFFEVYTQLAIKIYDVSISLRSFSSFKKMNKTLHIRSKITRENMKSDKNVEICTKRNKR